MQRWLVSFIVVWIGWSSSPSQAQDLCHEVFAPSLLARMAVHPEAPRIELATREEFPEHLAARIYMEFAKQDLLLQQSAPELNARGLLNPNGGLCGSTCITNVVGAMTAQASNFRSFRQNAPEILQTVVEAYNTRTGLDARMGAFMPQMAESTLGIMLNLLQRLQYDSMQREINISMYPSLRNFQASRLVQSMRGDAISIVSVRPANPQVAGIHEAHAIVVLRIDYENHKIYLSDPNLPSRVVKVDFEFTRGADIQFQVPFTYGPHPVVPFEFHTFHRSFYETQ